MSLMMILCAMASSCRETWRNNEGEISIVEKVLLSLVSYYDDIARFRGSSSFISRIKTFDCVDAMAISNIYRVRINGIKSVKYERVDHFEQAVALLFRIYRTNNREK